VSFEPTQGAYLKLVFVAAVCGQPGGLPPELQSWVVLFCQQAAVDMGIDFAVGRLSRPAALEAAR
jgi:hypothetical protein